ncbi:MAG: amidohydrolase family protein [Tissierellia bacterium]|nr:amidohydrolase family protein [Tissierellia bacterium]
MNNKKYIICGKFFDGVNEELKENIKIIVEDERIIAVGSDLECPMNAEVIDLSHLTVTPGLIDAHVHFDFIGPTAFSTYAINETDEMKTLNILYCAQKSLEGGFTTVRLVGTGLNSYGAIDMKNAIDKKRFMASRLIVSPHFLGTTGSHGDFSAFASSNPVLSDKIEDSYLTMGNGVDFFKKAVRKEVKYGADFIKIMATGGFASPNDAPDDMQLDNDELRAIIETAKQLHVPVTAHAYTSELIDNLINMGITGVEHGSLIKESTAKLMEEKGVYLVATFMPYEEVVNLDEEKLALKHKPFREKLEKFGEQLRETRKLLVDCIINSNMTIGYGTDIVAVYDNFDCWREFKAWRDNGIPALKTLKAATSVNAKIVERPEIGSLEVGKIADIVGWSRDILNDSEAISACDFVMKEGVVCKR